MAESHLLMRKLPDKCLYECELLPVCMGGCRQQALATRGDFNGVDCRYDSLRVFLEAYIREKAEETLAETASREAEPAAITPGPDRGLASAPGAPAP